MKMLSTSDEFYKSLPKVDKKEQELIRCVGEKTFLRNTFKLDRIDELLTTHAVTFSELVSFLKNKKMFDGFLFCSSELIQKLFKSHLISEADLTNIVDNIDEFVELNDYCHNTFCIVHALENSSFTLDHLSKFNTIVRNVSHCEHVGVYDIFDLLTYYHNFSNRWNLSSSSLRNSHHIILNLTDVARCEYLVKQHLFLTDSQRNELKEIFESSKKARNILKQLAENNLIGTYNDFKKLKNLLTKDEQKKKMKMNF